MLVDIHPDDLDLARCEQCGRGQPDIAQTDDRNSLDTLRRHENLFVWQQIDLPARETKTRTAPCVRGIYRDTLFGGLNTSWN
ncbi:hypothetical protein ANK1_3460 [plant metagenome]|uniref:Uncharacterized protein n=1 Tax=plant metagenome TaxID=1297885 RepID=A0A484P8I7_9ZZZZ